METNKPVTILILLIINLILVFLFVIPKYQESRKLQINFEKKQAKYDNQSNYQRELLGILNKIEEKREFIEKIDIAIPSNFSISHIVNFLQKKAEESQLVIKSIEFSQIKPQNNSQFLKENSEKKVKNVNMKVGLSGSYRGLKNILVALDRSERLFEVYNISFSSPQILINPNGSNLSNQLSIYDFKLEIKTNTY